MKTYPQSRDGVCDGECEPSILSMLFVELFLLHVSVVGLVVDMDDPTPCAIG